MFVHHSSIILLVGKRIYNLVGEGIYLFFRKTSGSLPEPHAAINDINTITEAAAINTSSITVFIPETDIQRL